MMKPKYLWTFVCVVLFLIVVNADEENANEVKGNAHDAAKDFCNPDPCKNGGSCLKYLKKCSCESEYYGLYCENCKCENGFCKKDDQGNSACACHPEWGKYSDTECKECNCGKDSNCTITDFWKTITCLCKVGYEAKEGFCTGTCNKNPCQNNGECVVKGKEIECKCPERFSGELCEKVLTTTETTSTVILTTRSTTREKTSPVTFTVPYSTKKKIISTTEIRIPTTVLATKSTTRTTTDTTTRTITGARTSLITNATAHPTTVATSSTTPRATTVVMPNTSSRMTANTTSRSTTVIMPNTSSRVTANTTTRSTTVIMPNTSSRVTASTTPRSTTVIMPKTSPQVTASTTPRTTTVIIPNTSPRVTASATLRSTTDTTTHTTMDTTTSATTDITSPTPETNVTVTPAPDENTSSTGTTQISPIVDNSTVPDTDLTSNSTDELLTSTANYSTEVEDANSTLSGNLTTQSNTTVSINESTQPEATTPTIEIFGTTPHTLDICPITPDKCNGTNEICLLNECACIENYKRNKKNDCIPNFCEPTKKKCQHNMMCVENPDDPENVKCICKETEVFNGTSCVEVSKCDLPHVLGCQQLCNASTESCGCYAGYTLQKDKKSCQLTTNGSECAKDCKPGVCYKYGGTESCICPPTHVYDNGTCKDLCTARSIPQGICPDDDCEPHPTLGFRCKCDGPLTYDTNNITCRLKLKCSEDNGHEVCANRSARCLDDIESAAGFTCKCAESEDMDSDRVCKRKCDLKKNQEKCFEKGAICDMEGTKEVCKCPPLLTFDKYERCQDLAKASYTGTIPFDKSRYSVKSLYAPTNATVDPDYSIMRRDLRNSMRLLFGSNYIFADVLSCSDSDTSLNCAVELQFKSDPKDQVKVIGDPGTCIGGGSDNCFIPPALVLNKVGLTPDLLSQTDPCMDRLKLANCGGQETTCRKLEKDGNFECTCSEGFASFGTIYPVTDRRTVIHKCQDVNECLVKESCPNTTTCLNTPGSYECLCHTGYRLLHATDDPKATGCVEVCHAISCGKGKCKVDGPHYSCKCDEGYAGANCDKEVKINDNSPKGAEIALITLSTLVVPLILFSLYMFHKYRVLSKKTQEAGYLDDNTSSLSLQPMRQGLS